MGIEGSHSVMLFSEMFYKVVSIFNSNDTYNNFIDRQLFSKIDTKVASAGKPSRVSQITSNIVKVFKNLTLWPVTI